MALIGEVNRQVRDALVDITALAMVEDRTERLMRLDEATDRIDNVLTQLVPSAGEGTSAREKAAAGRSVLVPRSSVSGR